MIANSKPNSKYVDGYLRVVVDSTGVQRVALPDGTCIPRITDTEVTQGTSYALRGMCTVVFAIVNPEELYLGYEEIELVSTTMATQGNDSVVVYRCNAYLDTTEQHADATQI
jgi:hypothetical protein